LKTKTYSLFALFVTLSLPCFANNGALKFQKTYSLTGKPLYGADYKYFNYVNINSKKRGSSTISTTKNFDSLSILSLKGDKLPGLADMVYEKLMERPKDSPLSLVGRLAEGINVSANFQTISFKMNPKAKWADGTPLTNKDVLFSYNLITNKNADLKFASLVKEVKKVTLQEGGIITFSFKEPEMSFLINGLLNIPILPKHYFEGKTLKEMASIKPMGSGPYKLGKWETSKFANYLRRNDYWGVNEPFALGRFNIDAIKYKRIGEFTTQVMALTAGEIDLLQVYMSKTWARELGDTTKAVKSGKVIKKKFKSYKTNGGAYGIFMNSRNEILKDQNVRQALALAFNFEWTNKSIFYGAYERMHSYYGPIPGFSGNTPLTEEEESLINELPEIEDIPEQVFKAPYKSSHNDYLSQDQFQKLLSELSPSKKITDSDIGLIKEVTGLKKLPGIITKKKYNSAVKKVARINTWIHSLSYRKNLVKAQELLKKAGWEILKDNIAGPRYHKGLGKYLELEFVTAYGGHLRLIQPWAYKLMKRLGVKVKITKVEKSIYIKRKAAYDFDLVLEWKDFDVFMGPILSRNLHSRELDKEYGINYSGVNNKNIDYLLDKLLKATSLKDKMPIARLIDRIIMYKQHIILAWHQKSIPVAYKGEKFIFPDFSNHPFSGDSSLMHNFLEELSVK
jgi:ABC-type oligopeptide transport system substrate-binding subunit